jgi:hypothetical protein
VEKFGAAIGCVYISRPDVLTKYGLLISHWHFPTLISARTIFAEFRKDPATNQQNPEKSVAGQEILGCGGAYIYPGWTSGQFTDIRFCCLIGTDAG